MANQHVVTYEGDWAVRGAGNSRVTSVFETKAKAIDLAIQIAKNQKSDVFIHGRDGKIQDRDSYGHDPFPPRDRKY